MGQTGDGEAKTVNYDSPFIVLRMPEIIFIQYILIPSHHAAFLLDVEFTSSQAFLGGLGTVLL